MRGLRNQRRHKADQKCGERDDYDCDNGQDRERATESALLEVTNNRVETQCDEDRSKNVGEYGGDGHDHVADEDGGEDSQTAEQAELECVTYL